MKRKVSVAKTEVKPGFQFEPLNITKAPLGEYQGAYNKMRAYQDWYTKILGNSIEFYAYLASPQDDASVITDVILAPLQDNLHAHTQVDADGVGMSARQAEAKGLYLRGWTHLHPGDWNFSSGEDKYNNMKVATGQAAANTRTKKYTKEYTLEQKVEGNNLIRSNRRLGMQYDFDLSKLDEDERKALLDEKPVLKKDRFVSMAVVHSLIMVGPSKNEKHYCETVVLDYRAEKVTQKQVTPILVTDHPNMVTFTDEEILINLFSCVKMDKPIKDYLQDKVSDKDLRKKVFLAMKDKIDSGERMENILVKPKIIPKIFKPSETPIDVDAYMKQSEARTAELLKGMPAEMTLEEKMAAERAGRKREALIPKRPAYFDKGFFGRASEWMRLNIWGHMSEGNMKPGTHDPQFRSMTEKYEDARDTRLELKSEIKEYSRYLDKMGDIQKQRIDQKKQIEKDLLRHQKEERKRIEREAEMQRKKPGFDDADDDQRGPPEKWSGKKNSDHIEGSWDEKSIRLDDKPKFNSDYDARDDKTEKRGNRKTDGKGKGSKGWF